MKFKRRKAIAQKKLEDEKQNLIRVTDILSELEKQVGPLERSRRRRRSICVCGKSCAAWMLTCFWQNLRN